MKRLADAGLGSRVIVSDLRDRFDLELDTPIALRLTDRPEARGFIRSDTGSLLIRDASERIVGALPQSLVDNAMPNSRKGLEFRWTRIDHSDIRCLFDTILQLMGKNTAGDSEFDPHGTPAKHRRQLGLEARITPLLAPVAGQFPRPWMTNLTDPSRAQIFIVGQNQAKTYPEDRLTLQRFMDAHFNRNGESCRQLYDELTDGYPSPTRRNMDALAKDLDFGGVVETNVICYSTARAGDLKEAVHLPGAKRGAEIFLTLLDAIRPKVVIPFGAGTIDLLHQSIRTLPRLVEPRSADEIRAVEAEIDPFGDKFTVQIITIPSLSPPRFNAWSWWWDDARAKVIELAGELVKAEKQAPDQFLEGKVLNA